jgi:predicted transport protein
MKTRSRTATDYKMPESANKWSQGVKANLETATGKSLSEWIRIAKACPHEGVNDRLNRLREEHGLKMARAGTVLEAAFGTSLFGENDPAALVDGLFGKSFGVQRVIYDAVAQFAVALGDVTISPRKSYIPFYRKTTFAALRPSKQGLQVGLAFKARPKSQRLEPVKNLGGGERISHAVVLADLRAFDSAAKTLLRQAYSEN